MVKKRKLYQRIVNSQKNVKFDDFVTVIVAFGFTLSRITGSHHIYNHPDIPQSISVQPSKHNQAKPYQIKQFLRLVEEYNLKLDGN